jgi:hypothetical protein
MSDEHITCDSAMIIPHWGNLEAVSSNLTTRTFFLFIPRAKITF